MSETQINNEDISNGLYPNVFKKIESTDIQINPFQAHKTFTVYSGSVTSSMLPLQGVYTDLARLPALGAELVYNDASNIDGSLQSIAYFSVNHLFYKNKKQPYNNFGQTNLNLTKKFLYETASILSFPQPKIGEGVKLASFQLTVPGTASFTSDRYGNINDSTFDTSSIINQLKLYEGFNEYFDTTRINYESSAVTYVDGVVASNGDTLPMGMAAKFDGADNQLILTKATSSITPQYPFKIELSGSNQIEFSAQGSPTYRSMITSSADVSSSWTHVVCQKTGSAIQMYVNGTLHASETNALFNNNNHPLSASSRIDNLENLSIGGYGIADANLQGQLDEIRVYNKALTATEVGYLADRTEGGAFSQTAVVGNIFEKQGIGVISTIDYRYQNILNYPFTTSYKSTVTIHELGVTAKIDQGDFNMSTNVTLTKDDNQSYRGFVSGSDFSPYITSIGLYNVYGELLAIGKLAQPIKKRNDVDVNFLIRMDLDKNIVK